MRAVDTFIVLMCLLCVFMIFTNSIYALPYNSWHATFVYYEEGQSDAKEMQKKFDAWKWKEGESERKWETSLFSSDKVEDAFKWLKDRSSENEISLFYFSGHAFTQNNGENEESSEEDPIPKGGGETDNTNEGIHKTEKENFSDDQIGEALRNIPGFTISIFDTCYAGGMVDGKNDINGKNVDGSNKHYEIVLMAAKEYELCQTLNGKGFFTKYLLDSFTPDTPTRSTFEEWYENTAEKYYSDYKKNPNKFSYQTFKFALYSSGDKYLSYNAIPEPTTLLLCLIGLVIVSTIIKKRGSLLR